MCLVCYDIEYACQRSQPPYATARPHASKGSFLEAFIPSISASAALTTELATHDGSFLAIGLLTLFESACHACHACHRHVPHLHHTFLLLILFILPLNRTRPPQKPDRLAVRVGLVSFTRLDWNGSLRSLRIWRYSLKCAESLTLWLRFVSRLHQIAALHDNVDA